MTESESKRKIRTIYDKTLGLIRSEERDQALFDELKARIDRLKANTDRLKGANRAALSTVRTMLSDADATDGRVTAPIDTRGARLLSGNFPTATIADDRIYPQELWSFDMVAGAATAFMCVLRGPNTPPDKGTVAIFLGDPHVHYALLKNHAKIGDPTYYDAAQTCGQPYEWQYFEDKTAFLNYKYPPATWTNDVVFSPRLVQWALRKYPDHLVYAEANDVPLSDYSGAKYMTPLMHEFKWMVHDTSETIHTDTRQSIAMYYLSEMLKERPEIDVSNRFDYQIRSGVYKNDTYARELFTCFMTYGIDPSRLEKIYEVSAGTDQTKFVYFPVSIRYISLYRAHWNKVTNANVDVRAQTMKSYFTDFIAEYFVKRRLYETRHYTLDAIDMSLEDKDYSLIGDLVMTMRGTDPFVSGERAASFGKPIPVSKPIYLLNQLHEDFRDAALGVICVGCRSVRSTASPDPNYRDGSSVIYDIVTSLDMALRCGYRKDSVQTVPECVISVAGSTGAECDSSDCIEFHGYSIGSHIGMQLRMLYALGAIRMQRGGSNYKIGEDGEVFVEWGNGGGAKGYACSRIEPQLDGRKPAPPDPDPEPLELESLPDLDLDMDLEHEAVTDINDVVAKDFQSTGLYSVESETDTDSDASESDLTSCGLSDVGSDYLASIGTTRAEAIQACKAGKQRTHTNDKEPAIESTIGIFAMVTGALALGAALLGRK